MLNMIKKYIRREDGAAGVEFAFVAMPFLLALLGVVETGRIGLAMNGVQYAVEQTSRYASINPDASDEDLQEYAEKYMAGMFVKIDNFNVQSSRMISSNVDFIQIDATYSHPTITGGLLGDFGKLNFSTYSKQPVI